MKSEKNPEIFEDSNLEKSAQVISVKEIAFKYFHYWWLFILFLAVAVLAAWLHLRYTTPMYKVASTLLIRNDNNVRPGGQQDAMLMGMMQMQSSNKQNEIEILKSRAMMARVVRVLNLNVQYYVLGNVKTTNIYKEAPFEIDVREMTDSSRGFSYEIHLSSKNTFKVGTDPKERYFGEVLSMPEGKFVIQLNNSRYSSLTYQTYVVSYVPEYLAAISFEGGLQVKPANDQSNVLELTYVTDNPRMGADILNALMLEYNRAAIEDKNETNKKIIAFLDDRLRLVETQLGNVEKDLQQFKTSQEVIDLPAQSAFYMENLGDMRKSLQEQEISLRVAQLLENYVQNPANRNDLVPSTLGLEDPTLLDLVGGYNKLVMDKKAQLQTGATAGNPVVQNLDANIEDARLKIIRNLDNIKKSYLGTIAALSEQNKGLQTKLSSIPEKEKQAREKTRQQEIKQTLYLYLLQKKEESSIALASTISSARVVDNALSIGSKISPKRIQIYTIALLAGLLIPILIIYLVDLLNDKVTVRSDITSVTNAPVLAEIGHSENDKVLLFPQKSRSVVAEQLRILRSNLNFVLGDRFAKPAILVTSSFSGEGKSFISTNLGATLALSGKRTVILEFDLRKPKIVEGLGLAKGHGQGLTNYIIGGASLDQLVQRVPQVENLFVISCGPVPPNPSEILLDPRVAELFKWLKENFDAVIIDTAPIGLVSDAVTLSQYVDSTLYVLRQRYTFKRQLNFIDELYRQRKLPRMGLLVNDVKVSGVKGYYGYGAEKYGYGYGYGITDGYYDDSNAGLWKKLKRKVFGK
ncbi:polysaccharide biosynthesis tyrosine autokinase [Pseudoflavitalea sp. G-6-1-2]|uniref:GumC family protein n=1 Tax=Pseudoflavitalea sp. G-6-1-2 TaxID=2728841 RepID=UPI00146B5700|nr:tyrosine-protein kinase [Pseudoflavitalea sp. G-6-1-2]NML19617.1 polysaccharide biosynthesis tyrosine autokinase [Pseudoflavitalea sp. G-6-1-2]